jgi:2-polyprenyl-3-methyl-5-hydroxy-6-metoxy-1,4-benzoquinol methylase
MRDIKDYIDKYVDEPFESTMVKIRKKTVIEQCNNYVHDSVLEIGCGMDPFFLEFKDFNRMVIAEPGDVFADNARKLAEDCNSEIFVVNGFLEENVETIKGLGIDFDFVILSSVLHELDEPGSMLESIRSLCNDTTVVHINVPNANSLHRLIAIEAGMISDVHECSEQMQLMQRRRTYDKDSLREEVESAGFEVLDEGSYFVKPFTHAQMQKCIDNSIIDDKVLLGLEKIIKYMPEYGAGIYVNARLRQS